MTDLIKIREVGVDWMVERINARKPFTFSRWGDSEWLAAFGQMDLDPNPEHDFFEQMGDELRGILVSRPSYLLGMQAYALREFGHIITPFLEVNQLQRLNWINADVFHQANKKRKLGPLIAALQDAPLVMVGPPHLGPVRRALRADAFIQVPNKNCYVELDRIEADVMAALKTMPRGTVVSISCSMPSNILVDRLHNRSDGEYLIADTGSIWDMHVGLRTRAYMTKIGVDSTGSGNDGWCYTDSQAADQAPAYTERQVEADIDGRVDEVREGQVFGWAIDKNAPGRRLPVDILLDGEVVSQTVADGMRLDLAQVGVGDGRHGFAAWLPVHIWDGQRHSLEVRVHGLTSALSFAGRFNAMPPSYAQATQLVPGR